MPRAADRLSLPRLGVFGGTFCDRGKLAQAANVGADEINAVGLGEPVQSGRAGRRFAQRAAAVA